MSNTISLIQAKRLKELGVNEPSEKRQGFGIGTPIDKLVNLYNAEELIEILMPIYNSTWYDVVTRIMDINNATELANYDSLTECLCEELIHILEGTA